MLKNISRLEHKIGDRVFQLLADSDSPINEVKEALFQFQKYIGRIEDQVKEQQEKASLEQEKKASEEVKKDCDGCQ